MTTTYSPTVLKSWYSTPNTPQTNYLEALLKNSFTEDEINSFTNEEYQAIEENTQEELNTFNHIANFDTSIVSYNDIITAMGLPF